MPPPLSAIDSISPAFNHTKQELFQPFRLAFWARMALVAVTTGEFYSSGGWSGFRYAAMGPRGGTNNRYQTFAGPNLEYLRQYFPLIVLGALLLVAGVIFWLYVSSVFRFILFNAVLTNRCNLKEEWQRWRSQGVRFFCWCICFGLAVTVSLGILTGAAVLLIFKSGAFQSPPRHITLLVLGGIGLFLALACLLILAALVSLFAKDFVVPVMAVENLGVVDAWRRVIRMLNAEKTAYGGYVLMKIVLAVGSAILFGILTLIALIALLVPLSIAGYGAYSLVKSAGLLLNPVTIGIAALLATASLGLIIYAAAFVSAPAMVFFQAYAIHFLGSRYSLLGERLHLPGPPSLSTSVASSPAG